MPFSVRMDLLFHRDIHCSRPFCALLYVKCNAVALIETLETG